MDLGIVATSQQDQITFTDLNKLRHLLQVPTEEQLRLERDL